MAGHRLELRGLSKVFATDRGPITAVDAVNFEVSGDDFFTMLGPSGCGKTTTLRMVAGLETITSGDIIFDGENFSQFSAFRRNIGMVFQSYALFPHMNVFENAAYGLKIRKLGRAEIKSRVTRILKLIGLADLSSRYPADLSGGQQQRVSIARALVYDPGMLLLDEPLANLDAKLRVEMREEIRRIQKELGIMSIYVTHDQEEAMSVSDRIAVFNLGRLMQIGKPEDVYAHPTSLFVSDFIGKANFFPVRIAGRDAKGAKAVLNNGAEVALERVQALHSFEYDLLPKGHDAVAMIRPEHVELAATGGTVPCTVGRVQFLGSFIRYVATCEGAAREVIIDSRRPVPGVKEGSAGTLAFRPSDAILFHKGDAR